MMEIKIREEQPTDYNEIANINYEAFINWHPDKLFIAEPLMVDLLRHNAMFDPKLSLVAVVEEKVVGHALFSPFHFIVLGVEEVGVLLAPIAVHPEFQNLGIGKMLMEQGHSVAKDKGYGFSLLCGHPSYYPKFGYKTHMYSLSGVKITIDQMEFSNEVFSERSVNSKDITKIVEEWKNLHKDDTLSLFPGTTISSWTNHSPACRCLVLLKNNHMIGFIRYVPSSPLRVNELVARQEDMPDILAYLAYKHYGKAQGELSLSLPIEQLEKVLDNLESFNVKDECSAYDAFMIKILREKSTITKYCTLMEKGEIKPGIIVFPSVFDIEEF